MKTKKPWYQELTNYYIPSLFVGFLALGAILDTFSNVVEWINPSISYLASFAFIIAFVASKWLPRKYRIPWIIKDDSGKEKLVYVKSTGTKITLILLGLQVAFWFPIILKGEESTFSRLYEISSIFQNDTEMLNLSNKSDDIFNNGWFSDQSNWDKMNETIKMVGEKKHDPQIDPEFRESTVNWCTNSLAQLTGERGQINGFVFEDELLKKDQEWTLQAYDATIIIIRQLLDMTGNWAQETTDIRNSRFDELISASLDARTAFGSLKVANPQILADMEEEFAEKETLYEEAQSYFRYLKHRAYSVALAVIASVILIGDIIVSTVKKRTKPVFFSSEKASKRKRKNKRDSKKRNR